jgi:hypothetical protein
MGKTTLYHPISLHVIRGAAEFCGFKFGKLKQLDSHEPGRHAWYSAEIESFPGGMDPDKASHKAIIGALRKCFMDDIRVTALWRTRTGKYFADLDVQLDRKPETEQALFSQEMPQ